MPDLRAESACDRYGNGSLFDGREARFISARIAAMLAVRGRGHFNDLDVVEAARLAFTGLAHQPAA